MISRNRHCNRFVGAFALLGFAFPAASEARAAEPLRFDVRFPKSKSEKPLDGRLLLMVSTDPKAEPRFQIIDGPKTQQAFGIDVEGLKPDEPAIFDDSAYGYPIESLSKLKPGAYRVQALLHRYETFKRADGHTVKLPMDRGEGQQWNKAPGNLYSSVQEISIHPAKGGTIAYRAHSRNSAHTRPADDKVYQTRENPERPSDEVLGKAHAPGRPCASA